MALLVLRKISDKFVQKKKTDFHMFFIRTFVILAAWVKDLPKETDIKLIYQLEMTQSERKFGKDLDSTFDPFLNPMIEM